MPSGYSVCMRTTLTLDADVATALQALAREQGITWKAVVNDVLRRGLVASSPPVEGYRVRAVSLGTPAYPNLDDIAEVLLAAESDE